MFLSSYRYLPKSRSLKGGLVPNSKTTVSVIKALLDRDQFKVVLDVFDPVGRDMHRTYLEYFKWKKALRNSNLILNPLSSKEMRALERSSY